MSFKNMLNNRQCLLFQTKKFHGLTQVTSQGLIAHEVVHSVKRGKHWAGVAQADNPVTDGFGCRVARNDNGRAIIKA